MSGIFNQPGRVSEGSPAPAGRILSNGRIAVLITSAGTGTTMFAGGQLNVWSGDRVEDREGFFFYIRDLDAGAFRSAGRQPAGMPADSYAWRREPGVFAITRRDGILTTRMEVCVLPDDAGELRRISLENGSDRPCRIEITSYIEVCLLDAPAHAAHPAFSKLFIQTSATPDGRTLLASRRPRANAESHPWMVHSAISGPPPSFETDRSRFLGRLGALASPVALRSAAPLSGTVGNVLDPILCLRSVHAVAPGARASSTFLLGAAEDRERAIAMAARAAGMGFDGARSEAARVEDRIARIAGLSAAEADRAQALAAAILYGDPILRAAPEVLRRAAGSLADIERLGLSRARPFVVFDADADGGPPAAAVVAWHQYWKALALPIDLLIVADDPARIAAGETGAVPVIPAHAVDSSLKDRIEAAARLVLRGPVPDWERAGARS